MFGAAILGLTTPLRVCTVSTCGRNGGQAFCDAVQTLSAGTELQVTASGCMSRCRGIVVAGGHLKATTSLSLQLSKGDTVSTLESAVSFLDEAGIQRSQFRMGINGILFSRIGGKLFQWASV